MSSLRPTQPKLTVIEGQMPAKRIKELGPDNPRARSLAKWFLVAILLCALFLLAATISSSWR